MSEILIDLHLPFLIIALLIGCQISAYFFYLYLREKKNNLALNKLLLAYGFLYSFAISSVFFRMLNAYFIFDVNIKNLFIAVSYGLVFCAALSYLIITSLKGFDPIIKTKISKIMMILALIFSFLIFCFQSLIQLIFIIIGSSIAAIYLLVFHYRLIKISVGNIKKRMILFTIGSAVILIGVILEADEIIGYFSEDIQTTMMILSVPIFVAGELIVFLGVYQFSAFLDFDWKDHIIGLYIIDRASLNLLYKHEFQDITKQSQFKTLAEKLSKGIMGIDQIINAISNKQKDVERIIQEEIIFLLQSRDIDGISLSYILLVNKGLDSFPYFLKKLIKKFEDDYKSILLHLDVIIGKEDKMFAHFDTILNDIMSK